MSQSWARQEFGAAQLGDPRRTERAVELAARAAERPGGTVTGVVQGEAAREGAFRFLRNTHVGVRALACSSHDATIERSRDEQMVFVALDQCSLGLTDRLGRRTLALWARSPPRRFGACRP